MSMQDPISNLLTVIRNGQSAKKKFVKVPFSLKNIGIAKVLFDEGYIKDYKILKISKNKISLEIFLKYYEGEPVISKILRISKPSLRVYSGKKSFPVVLGGFGISIISTSFGIISDKKAKKIGCGGEVLCTVE